MKYEDLPILNREQALRALKSEDLRELRTTVAALKWMDDDDDEWILATLESYLTHPDTMVAGNAIVGVSEAIRTRRTSDVNGRRLRRLIATIDREDLVGYREDALPDIDHGISWGLDRDLPRLDRREAETRLASEDLSVLRETVAALRHIEGENEPWAHAQLLRFVDHADEWVSGNALQVLTALVYEARVEDGGFLDRAEAKLSTVADARPDISERARRALDAIRTWRSMEDEDED